MCICQISLRKLSRVAAYSKIDNYIKILEIFMNVKNLSVENSYLQNVFIFIGLNVKDV